jgi:hypothetical protein
VRKRFNFFCAFTNSTPIKLGDIRPLAYTHNICIRRSECLATKLCRFIPGGKRKRNRLIEIKERMRGVKEGRIKVDSKRPILTEIVTIPQWVN